jgi:shingomyelin synthase
LDEGIEDGVDWSSEDLDDCDVSKNRSSLNVSDVGGVLSQNHKYPKEKRKTFFALGLLVLGFILNSISIALVHDRVPDRNKYPPLPDALLDNIHIIPELMKVPDVFVIIIVLMSMVVIGLHRHRWIVARRTFFILSVLYVMRSITMYVTVLPVANSTVFCSPKANYTSPGVVFYRVYELIGGGGMQISGQKKICGDYIYSGHTAILMVGHLLIQEYSPKGLSILPWISSTLSWSGMIILLIARGHYTIDVIIGYYAATRMFWTYHSWPTIWT